MEQIRTVGLDIAKSVFQVHGVDEDGEVIVRRRLKRARVLPFECFASVIRGYDAARKGGRSGPLAICIDTATGPTGPLSAPCFDPDGAIIERI